ncbi:MAG: putative phosphoribosyl transferase [Planctomycetaceae bacterium]|nr:putative phosphoribosyl transferase [Planctomycetaceae bacterium]
MRIAAGNMELTGDLTFPAEAQGIVVFAHGSGSSSFSPRNRFVAETLQESGLATLLMDLLTPEEELQDQGAGRLLFNIDLLADRLVDATQWLAGDSRVARLPVGYFGASTGAGARLWWRQRDVLGVSRQSYLVADVQTSPDWHCPW